MSNGDNTNIQHANPWDTNNLITYQAWRDSRIDPIFGTHSSTTLSGTTANKHPGRTRPHGINDKSKLKTIAEYNPG